MFLWDTAGQEMFRSVTSMYYTSVAVTIVVYDISERESFEKIGEWLDEFHEKYRKKPGDGV